MAKNTYQTFTNETPISVYREDFIRRGALCAALSKRHPALAPIGQEADAILAQIDQRSASLQSLEDNQVRARALEDAEKFDTIEVYTELRRTMFAKNIDFSAILPDAPSSLDRLNAKSFGERMDLAVANLKALPDGDALKSAFLAPLEKELAEFATADKAEDVSRINLRSGKAGLLVYKSELSQAREAQLGAILTILRDRERTALFTIPWRKISKADTQDDAPAAPAATAPPEAKPQ